MTQHSQPQTIDDLREDQRAIALHEARFKVVACGRRWGKTALGIVMALEAARRGERVWWVAPTYGLAFHPWRALKSILTGGWAAKLESERFIELPDGGTLTVKSADDPDALRGVGLDFVVVDEAAFMSEEAWTAALRPALSDRQGRALIISTPRGRNWFWRVFTLGGDPLRPDWASWRYPTGANPRIAPEEIDEARRLLPERIFRQEYEAEFLADGGEVFHSVRRAVCADLPAGPLPGHRYVMGVDFGRYRDFTALAVVDATAGALVALDRFSGPGWTVQRERIAGLARRWRVEGILAEANAMGEPNIEALRRDGLPVAPFVTTALSKPPLIEGLVKALEELELRLPDDPVLLAELEGYTYSTTRGGHTIYGAPPGGHDDTVIALALAWKLASAPRLALGVIDW